MSKTIELPCEIGDTIYIVSELRGIVPAKVRTFWIGRLIGQTATRELMIRTDYCDVPAENIGKTAFLSYEEAERAEKINTL